MAPREPMASRPFRDEKLFLFGSSYALEHIMYYPSRTEFQELARQGSLIPVYRELNADLETPVSVYLKLRGEHESFLLESVEGGEQLARYSFIGADPSSTIVIHGDEAVIREFGSPVAECRLSGDPLEALRSIVQQDCAVPVAGLPRFFGGAVGFLSYDIVRQFERVRTGKHSDSDRSAAAGVPDAVFIKADTLVAFDHVKHRALIIANAKIQGNVNAAYEDAVQRIEAIVQRLKRPLSDPGSTSTVNGHVLESNVTPLEFADKVRRAQEHIAAGDIFQVVLSQRFQRHTTADGFSIYRSLRRLNPSPYMFFIDFGDMQLIGSSPEMLVRLEDDTAQLNPIAGTRPRGRTEDQDRLLEEELRRDPKERAEHVMLVDLGRNDLGRVCEYGSVEVADLMTVERYSHVMHLVSHVTGRLRKGLDAFDLLKATFPAGTVSGAPKVRAMEIIDDLEGASRGPYAGAVGYLGFPTAASSGNMDLCITIRTIVMRGRQAIIQAGAGIVADSIPEQEHQECVNKASALAEAIGLAERGG